MDFTSPQFSDEFFAPCKLSYLISLCKAVWAPWDSGLPRVPARDGVSGTRMAPQLGGAHSHLGRGL